MDKTPVDKSPDAFRTISEVADDLQTPAHVLRFWESRFPQIRPVKRAGGRRYYRPSDVALLAGIRRLLHDEGMTIRGVQKVLREQGVRHVAGLSQDDPELPEDVVLPPDDAAMDGAEDGAEEFEASPPKDDGAAPDDQPPPPMPDRAAEDMPPADLPPPAAAATAPPAAEQPEPDDAALPPMTPPPSEPQPVPPPVSDLPLFAGQDLPATPARPTVQRPALSADRGEGEGETTLAARLRALPPGALAQRHDKATAILAALADLHARLSDRARGPRR